MNTIYLILLPVINFIFGLLIGLSIKKKKSSGFLIILKDDDGQYFFSAQLNSYDILYDDTKEVTFEVKRVSNS